MNKKICKIPIRATYKIDGNSDPKLISADYANIPADYIARFLIQKFGTTPIIKGIESE